MKPRRTLLVVINKKVEWGILSVADIAVKWVNFRLHRSGGPRGTELAACDALAKALDYLPLALDQAAGCPRSESMSQRASFPGAIRRRLCHGLWPPRGAGVGFAGYLRLLG